MGLSDKIVQIYKHLFNFFLRILISIRIYDCKHHYDYYSNVFKKARQILGTPMGASTPRSETFGSKDLSIYWSSINTPISPWLIGAVQFKN